MRRINIDYGLAPFTATFVSSQYKQLENLCPKHFTGHGAQYKLGIK